MHWILKTKISQNYNKIRTYYPASERKFKALFRVTSLRITDPDASGQKNEPLKYRVV